MSFICVRIKHVPKHTKLRTEQSDKTAFLRAKTREKLARVWCFAARTHPKHTRNTLKHMETRKATQKHTRPHKSTSKHTKTHQNTPKAHWDAQKRTITHQSMGKHFKITSNPHQKHSTTTSKHNRTHRNIPTPKPHESTPTLGITQWEALPLGFLRIILRILG